MIAQCDVAREKTEDSVEGRSTNSPTNAQIQCVLELHIGPTKLKSSLLLGRPSVSCKSTCCKSQVLLRHINLNVDIPKL